MRPPLRGLQVIGRNLPYVGYTCFDLQLADRAGIEPEVSFNVVHSAPAGSARETRAPLGRSKNRGKLSADRVFARAVPKKGLTVRPKIRRL